MPTRPTALALCAGLVLLAGACDGAEQEGAETDTAPAANQLRSGTQAYEPIRLPCDPDATLTAPNQDSVIVELSLEDGKLAPSKESLVVRQGQLVRWRSEKLHLRITFLTGKSPYGSEDDITGAPGAAVPEGDAARIVGEPGCYYYVAAGVDPDSVGPPLVLDPPIIVKD